MIDLAGFELALHSTVVLLKEPLNLPDVCRLPPLHSTVVLLKAETRSGQPSRIITLHTTVVLLKDKKHHLRTIRCFSFTFYCSSIKRILSAIWLY